MNYTTFLRPNFKYFLQIICRFLGIMGYRRRMDEGGGISGWLGGGWGYVCLGEDEEREVGGSGSQYFNCLTLCTYSHSQSTSFYNINNGCKILK